MIDASVEDLRGREPRPADFAGQAQHVEQGRIVAIEPRRQHRPLPGAGGQLEPVQERNGFAHAVEAGELRAAVHVVPGEEEPHEVGRRHRLDFCAQPVQRIAMDAREERTVAPFQGTHRRITRARSRRDRRIRRRRGVRPRRREPPAQDDPFGLQGQQAVVDVRIGYAEAARQHGGRDRALDGEAAPDDFGDRRATGPGAGGADRRRVDDGIDQDAGVHRLPFGQSFGGDEQRAVSIG